MGEAVDQDAAYERAVIAVRSRPVMRSVVEEAFLHEDAREAVEAFRTSEHGARVRRLLLELHIHPGARVLDFGGGRGVLSAALALDGYRVTLCEINPSPVCGTGAARELRAATGGDFAIVGDLSEALEANSAYDAVVCRAVLHHLAPLAGVLAEVATTLQPGTWLLAVDEPTLQHPRDLARLRAMHPFVSYGVDEQAYTVAAYTEALARAGFDHVRVRFPVAFADYRRHIRSGPTAPLRYGLYRLRSRLRPQPGDVRTFLARRGPVPATDGT